MSFTRRLERYAQLGALAGRIGATAVAARVAGRDPGTDDPGLRARAEDLARTLGKLRGGAMKLGQSLAIAADHLDLAPEIRLALGTLHAKGEPLPFAGVRATIERDLGASLEELYASVDPAPLGTASLAQAHAARLHDGRDVVIKVLHEGVEDAVAADLATLDAAGPAWRALGRDPAELRGALDELRARVIEELDYAREADNTELFHTLYAGDARVRIPGVVRDRCGSRVLTLDRLPGRPIDPFIAVASRDARSRAARTLAELFFEQTFRHRVLHADPHPGNYLFEPDGRVGVLDFGCVKQFSVASIGAYARIVRSSLAGDRQGALDGVRAFGAWTGDDPAAADSIWQFCEAAVRPWRTGEYEVGESEPSLVGHLRPQSTAMFRHADIVGPPDVLFLHRTVGGIYALGRKLGGRAAWRTIAEPHLDAAIRAAELDAA